jgi:histone-binding protein RBBP4
MTTTSSTSSASTTNNAAAPAAISTTTKSARSTVDGVDSTTNGAVDVLQERMIDAEYKIWKKNTPYLYDFVLTHSLDWPSLTCQWLPTVKKTHSDLASEHSVLIGTHTTGEQNFLMVATVGLPKDDTIIDPTSNNTYAPSNTSASASASKKDGTKPAPRYDEEKKEVGGFGLAPADVGKIEVTMKVLHEGEVNRARYMPQNHFVVASRGPGPQVYIFDLSKHPSMPSADAVFCPQAVCIGHESEGYGMVWSPHQVGRLLTASEDASVKLWDVEHVIAPKSRLEAGTTISALATLLGHTAPVQDVDWHPKDPHLVISVGDDAAIRLWDIRTPLTSVVASESVKIVSTFKENLKGHTADVNCVAFNPVNEHVYATGSSDHSVALWDIRSPTQ